MGKYSLIGIAIFYAALSCSGGTPSKGSNTKESDAAKDRKSAPGTEKETINADINRALTEEEIKSVLVSCEDQTKPETLGKECLQFVVGSATGEGLKFTGDSTIQDAIEKAKMFLSQTPNPPDVVILADSFAGGINFKDANFTLRVVLSGSGSITMTPNNEPK